MTGCGLESHWPGIGGQILNKNLEYAPRPKGTPKAAKWNPNPKGSQMEPKGHQMDPKGSQMDPKGSQLQPKVAPREAKGTPKTPKGSQRDKMYIFTNSRSTGQAAN